MQPNRLRKQLFAAHEALVEQRQRMIDPINREIDQNEIDQGLAELFSTGTVNGLLAVRLIGLGLISGKDFSLTQKGRDRLVELFNQYQPEASEQKTA